MLSAHCEPPMAGKPGALSEKPTQLPARYRERFAWQLDRRVRVVREIAADLMELWNDLGGYESLSTQQRWLCERVVYLRRRCLAFESVSMHNLSFPDDQQPLPMDAGTYSNHANVLQAQLRTLGLERRQKTVRGLRDVMSGAAA
jgi:hypothetical protein